MGEVEVNPYLKKLGLARVSQQNHSDTVTLLLVFCLGLTHLLGLVSKNKGKAVFMHHSLPYSIKALSTGSWFQNGCS